jgi:hypothetical protein
MAIGEAGEFFRLRGRMERLEDETQTEAGKVMDTGGPPCGEAQADGVPCEETGADCEDCDRAEPEAREVYKTRLKRNAGEG